MAGGSVVTGGSVVIGGSVVLGGSVVIGGSVVACSSMCSVSLSTLSSERNQLQEISERTSRKNKAVKIIVFFKLTPLWDKKERMAAMRHGYNKQICLS